MPQHTLLKICDLLFAKYGPQHWWPAGSPFEVCVGAILTQSAAWVNVKKAITNLKQTKALSPAALRNMATDELATLLYSCGYYNAKAKKLKAFVEHLIQQHDDNLTRMFNQPINGLRTELLSIHGVGDETADSIILYAASKSIFVIDAYTRRIFGRLGFEEARAGYTDFQTMFMNTLPHDTKLFNEYHALLVNHGKNVCKKIPLCSKCCIEVLCQYQRDKISKV
ncbi:endonuclease III domain-containing protein [Chloroflexota bacterium]